jgi:hypothetical protein
MGGDRGISGSDQLIGLEQCCIFGIGTHTRRKRNRHLACRSQQVRILSISGCCGPDGGCLCCRETGKAQHSFVIHAMQFVRTAQTLLLCSDVQQAPGLQVAAGA